MPPSSSAKYTSDRLGHAWTFTVGCLLVDTHKANPEVTFEHHPVKNTSAHALNWKLANFGHANLNHSTDPDDTPETTMRLSLVLKHKCTISHNASGLIQSVYRGTEESWSSLRLCIAARLSPVRARDSKRNPPSSVVCAEFT
jgi:hypothetical protein